MMGKGYDDSHDGCHRHVGNDDAATRVEIAHGNEET